MLNQPEVRPSLEARVSDSLAGSSVLTLTLEKLLKEIAVDLESSLGLWWQAIELQDELKLSGVFLSEPDPLTESLLSLDQRLRYGPEERSEIQVLAVSLQDLSTDPLPLAGRALALQKGLSTAIQLPLIADQTFYGLMEFYSNNQPILEAENLVSLSRIARHIGQWIQRIQSLEARLENTPRYLSMFKAALDCIITMDAQGILVDLNPAAEKTFGYTREVAIGQPLADLIIPPQYRARHRQGLERYLSTRQSTILGKRLELTAVNAEGREFPVELIVTDLQCSEPPLFAGFIRDLSAWKALEKAHLENTERLALQQAQRIEEAEAHRKQQADYMDTICHELRNPLQGIYGNRSLQKDNRADLERLILQADPQKMDPVLQQQLLQALVPYQETQEAIDSCARHQRRLIDDLLNLSKLDAGKMLFVENPFNAKQVVKDVMTMLDGAFKQKNIETLLKFSYKKERVVYGDAGRITQVLLNLVSNAIKFSPEGSTVTMSLAESSQQVDTQQLVFSVEDQGMGLSPEEQSQLFNRFVQVGSSMRPAQEGSSGLGLAISKSLVEGMGGQLVVRSRQGAGSCFSFELLLKTIPKALSVPIPQPLVSPSLQAKKRLTILVVEDSLMNQKILVRLLERAGYACRVANHGQEAVDSFKQEAIDVILMDVQMPVMDGLKATQAIRDLEQGLDLSKKGPVIIIGISANAGAKYQVDTLQAGMDDYLLKPYEEAEVLALLDRLVAEHLLRYPKPAPSDPLAHRLEAFRKRLPSVSTEEAVGLPSTTAFPPKPAPRRACSADSFYAFRAQLETTPPLRDLVDQRLNQGLAPSRLYNVSSASQDKSESRPVL